MSIKEKIKTIFKKNVFTLKDAYYFLPEETKPSIRARIYENLDKDFLRISKGVYQSILENTTILIEGNGRDLSGLQDSSIDCIITDHPWEDKKSNVGGNRSFTNYDCFKYSLEDFKEKFRVLKDGNFLVEFIPSENSTNYEYLFEIKKLAEQAGFLYYAKVPWIKGNFVSNTGRNAKNSEDVLIFSKGKARSLRPDVKKNLQSNGVLNFMSGTRKMLPHSFNYQPPVRKDKIHQSEKPLDLIMDLLDHITFENEIVLDQFAGSGVVGLACSFKERTSLMFEISKEYLDKIKERFIENERPLVVLESK